MEISSWQTDRLRLTWTYFVGIASCFLQTPRLIQFIEMKLKKIVCLNGNLFYKGLIIKTIHSKINYLWQNKTIVWCDVCTYMANSVNILKYITSWEHQWPLCVSRASNHIYTVMCGRTLTPQWQQGTNDCCKQLLKVFKFSILLSHLKSEIFQILYYQYTINCNMYSLLAYWQKYYCVWPGVLRIWFLCVDFQAPPPSDCPIVSSHLIFLFIPWATGKDKS